MTPRARYVGEKVVRGAVKEQKERRDNPSIEGKGQKTRQSQRQNEPGIEVLVGRRFGYSLQNTNSCWEKMCRPFACVFSVLDFLSQWI